MPAADEWVILEQGQRTRSRPSRLFEVSRARGPRCGRGRRRRVGIAAPGAADADSAGSELARRGPYRGNDAGRRWTSLAMGRLDSREHRWRVGAETYATQVIFVNHACGAVAPRTRKCLGR